MYKNFFGITVKPFSIAPDPSFLYMSEGHREALAHLRYGMENEGGFILLTGEVGTGKTTVCRCLLEQIPDKATIAYVINPKLTAKELLATICDELTITYSQNASAKTLVDDINTFLLESHAQSRHTILIIDEAQNLSTDVLEQIRLLTNLETNSQKLLQVILLGQPELKTKLASDNLRQLSQRISARHHLGPLSKSDTKAYVRHRLTIVGLPPQTFSDRSINCLYALSGGIPRLINIIADRAMLGAYAKGSEKITTKIMEAAGREVFGDEKSKQLTIVPRWLIAGATTMVCSIILLLINYPAQTLTDDSPPQKTQISAEDRPADLTDTTPEHDSPSVWPVLQAPSGEKLALKKLLELWKIADGFSDDMWPCQYAEEFGLRCLVKKGGIKNLLRLNRPAALQMSSDSGEEFFATITAVDDDMGTFSVGPQTFTAELSELALRWDGDFIAIWQPPASYEDSIRPGHQGPDVSWLAEQLALIDGEEYNDSEPVDYFDKKLTNRVKKLQFNNNLVPDGIVGKETITLLNTLSGKDVPTLYHK